METAEYISGTLQLPIEKSKDWRETNNGILAGMPNDEANRRFPAMNTSIHQIDYLNKNWEITQGEYN